MSSKADLLKRIQFLNEAINEPYLIDIGIALSRHNEIANLLRRGIGIVAFNILEDYINRRNEEALHYLSNSGILFDRLTLELQNRSTYDALKSLAFHSNMIKKDPSVDLISLIQEETGRIQSTQSFPYNLSKFTLKPQSFNVTSSDVKDFLKCFGIPDVWNSLQYISNSFGGGITDLATSFNNAYKRRNNAAHDAAFNYSNVWLRNIKAEILAIAASIDIIIEAQFRGLIRNTTSKMGEINFRDEINFRFLQMESATIIKERKRIGGKSIKNWSNIDLAIASLRVNNHSKKEILIILDNTQRITDWICS